MIRTVAAFLTTVVAAGAWAMLSPAQSIQPGRLLDGHAALRDDCLACHAIGRGVDAARCVKCHVVSDIGVAGVDGAPLATPRPAVQRLHRPLSDVECAACHAEHAGRLGGGSAARFTHDALPVPLRDDCARCHEAQRPADVIHRAASLHCGPCHGTRGWKPARFDHAALPAGTACAPCHATRMPADEVHLQSAAAGAAATDCGTCHRTGGWTPAAYDHDRYFRFDKDHPPRCADCHEPGRGFKSYSCDRCHPPSRIASKHRKEGIQDFADCVKCHRSADEHEAGRDGGSRETERGGHGHDDDDEDK